ncbi:MAG TPA: Crp/Fnr family transcriptional regulator [Firmicutes bacterium]|nr:Crp/Fnr family transcriptional regulator [Bacillota bacterium]
MQKEETLSRLPFFCHLTEEQKRRMLESSRIASYQAGDLIYTPVRECLGMTIVLSGSIRTYLVSESGKKATIFRLRSGEVCILSMTCLLSAITFDVEVEAAEDCSLLIIPAPVFASISQENIYAENFSYKVVADRFSNLIEAVQQMMFMTLEQRVVAYLLDESSLPDQSSIQQEPNTAVVLITQEQLAENIGSAREAVSRVLKQLKGKGLVSVERGKIFLHSKKDLYGLL